PQEGREDARRVSGGRPGGALQRPASRCAIVTMKAVMKRWVLVSNAALIGISLASVVYIAREVRSPAQIPPAPIGLAAKAGAPIALVQEAPAPPAPRYGLVVSRNLFSPTRSDAAASSPTLTTPKPHLSGVVLRDGMLIA